MVKSEKSSIKTNIFLLVFLGIIILVTIFSALNPNFGQVLDIRNWFDKDALEEVPFLDAVGFTMLACFIGALIPVPVPYALPISIFSAVWISVYGPSAWGLILLLVAFAALANTIGDLIDYMIGRGAEYVLSQDDPELQNRWSQIILKKPKAIPGIIFIFGLTPLPDSLLMVPLGIVEYDIKKAAIWMYFSRYIHFLVLFAITGALAMEWVFSDTGSDGTGWIYGVVLLYVIWGIIVLMVKYKPKKEQEQN